MVNIEYIEKVNKEIKEISELKSILERVYKEKTSNTIVFNGKNDMYISIDFDEYSKNGEASTYINLKNLYLRDDRTIDNLLDIVNGENII